MPSKMRTFAMSLVTVALTTTLLVAAPSAQAAPSCAKLEDGITTTKGKVVWIPGSLITPWVDGGSKIAVAWQVGYAVSTAKGSSKSISNAVGIKVSVAEATRTYNDEWNYTTSTSANGTQSFKTSRRVPKGDRYRYRMFHKGREFKVTRTRYYANCPPKKMATSKVRVPFKKESVNNRWISLEKYSKRNKFRYDR